MVIDDWQAWHRLYDDPASGLAERLEAVRRALARTLDGFATDRDVRITSICAGDGRDALPVVAQWSARRTGRARVTLLEPDPGLATTARDTAEGLGLAALVEVREMDAGLPASYDGLPEADVFLACGVLGHLTDDDLARLVAAFPHLVADDGMVIWTRGGWNPYDPSRTTDHPAELVRRVLAEGGLVEESHVRAGDTEHRVGVHRLSGRAPGRDLGDARIFRFASAPAR